MNWKRLVRKGAVELVPLVLVLVVGYFADNAEAYGISGGGLWVLLQVRRALRDATQGVPA